MDETKVERNQENISNHEKRLCILEENDKTQDKRLETHGKQIDAIIIANANQDKNQELMKKDLESIKRTNEKIEDKVDKIIQKPSLNLDKYKVIILGLVAGYIFSVLVRGLFPHIGG